MFHARSQVMTAADVARVTTRIAHEIVERNRGVDGVVLIGLQRGGVWLTRLRAEVVSRIDGGGPVPHGSPCWPVFFGSRWPPAACAGVFVPLLSAGAGAQLGKLGLVVRELDRALETLDEHLRVVA